MGVAGLRGTGATRVRPHKPGAWRRVTVRCECGEWWESTCLAEVERARCRRCERWVDIPCEEER